MVDKVPDNILWSVVDGEAVLLDMDSGHYYSLNQIATEIWTALHNGKSEAEIAEAIAYTYMIEQSVAASDVAELIGELRASRLLL